MKLQEALLISLGLSQGVVLRLEHHVYSVRGGRHNGIACSPTGETDVGGSLQFKSLRAP